MPKPEGVCCTCQSTHEAEWRGGQYVMLPHLGPHNDWCEGAGTIPQAMIGREEQARHVQSMDDDDLWAAPIWEEIDAMLEGASGL